MPQSFRCQIVGCADALPSGKAYYRRYRICVKHASAQCIEFDGISKRWCQQCGRFQEIAAFDRGKKTCRQRLAQHNATRRLARERRSYVSSSPRAAKQPKTPPPQDSAPPETTLVVSGDSAPSTAPTASAVVPTPNASLLPPRAVFLSEPLDPTALDALDGIDADVDTLLEIIDAPSHSAGSCGNSAGPPAPHALPKQHVQRTNLSMATVREHSLRLFDMEPEALPPMLLSSLVSVLEARNAHIIAFGEIPF